MALFCLLYAYLKRTHQLNIFLKSFEFVFRYRDPQLQVGKNDMYNLNQNICEFSKFIVKIPDSLKYGGEIKKKTENRSKRDHGVTPYPAK